MKNIYLFVAMILLFADASMAQKTLFDLEPNNEPLTAQTFSGEHQLSGSLADQDQDLFVWNLTDAAADYFWDIELTGVPGRLTQVDIMQLEFTADGQGVKQNHKLLTLRHYDGLNSVSKKDLVLTPGQYHIGFSYADDPSHQPNNNPLGQALSGMDDSSVDTQQLLTAGTQVKAQNNYNLKLIKKKKILPIRFPKDTNKPAKINKNKQLGLLLSPDPLWMSFKLNEKEALNTWQITGRASLNSHIHLSLLDAEKNLLAETSSDAEGHYSFDGLKLSMAEYSIQVKSNTPNHMASLMIKNTGVYVEGNEIEPNNHLKTANKLSWDKPLSGLRNNQNDVDYFEFTISEEQSTNNTTIELKNPDQSNIEFCLRDHKGYNLKCIEQASDMKMNQLSLTTGTYFVYIYRGDVEANYELQVSNSGKRKQIQEAEPNDQFKHAAIMTDKRLIKGQFEGNEFDYYQFETTEKPQLWTIQANGSNIREINLYNAAGSAVQSMSYPAGNKRARLSQLFLMPGTHVVSVRGADSSYLLRAFPTGDPDPDFEFEPNDDVSRAMTLSMGGHKKGILSEDRDVDIYRFSLANKERVQLKLSPPEDGSIRYILSWVGNNIADKTSAKGQPLTFEGLLNAGDYKLTLRAAGGLTSDAAYKVQISRLPRYSCVMDCEPNDSYQQATPIKPTSFIKGIFDTHGDVDWYQLPTFSEETKVTFKNQLHGNSQYLRVYDHQGEKNVEIKPFKEPNDPSLKSFLIPAGVSPDIRIYGANKTYDYSLLINGIPTSKPITPNSDIDLQLQGLPNEVAAYHAYAQQVSGSLSINNLSATDKVIELRATTADFKWFLSGLPASITLKANQQTQLPFELKVAKQTNGMQSVRLSFAATDSTGYTTEVWHDVEVNGMAKAVNPELDFSLPEALQGGLNVAAANFGGEMIDTEQARLAQAGRGYASLFNGYGFTGYGMIYRMRDVNENHHISIQLAGDQPMDVVGLILNPASDSNPANYLHDFEFQLSMDGVTFETVLRDQITAIGIEQAFVLPKKTTAKYARLVFLSNSAGIKNPNIGLGEWKVIADPEQKLKSGPGFNLADPELGGFVAWSEPQLSGSWNINLLKSDDKKQYIRSQNNNNWQWVIGFHNQRAALIDRIHWQKPAVNAGDTQTFNQVTVSVASQSPVGPWQLVGQYDLPERANTLQLEQPLWARYVKFSVGNVKPKEYRYPPEFIQVFEAPVSENYASILGEWGELSQQAIFEKSQQNMGVQKPLAQNKNNQKSSAQLLIASDTVAGQVQLEHADKPDWYKYQVPQGQNTLRITLGGKPTVNTVMKLTNQQGEQVPYTLDTSDISQVVYQATVEAGKTYFMKVEEPPRSVIFSWDTSGSTSKYHAVIFQALSQFTDGVIADRDTVNFLPFGGELLMDQWYGEPYLLKTILNNYDRKDDSSSAEKTLIDASQALSNRQGAKSIVLITDALTGSHKDLWQHLRAVKPRIFSIGLIAGSSGQAHRGQFDLMQSWSRVNNGEFEKIVTHAELAVAFDKAATKLRQPATYTIKAESEFLEAPGPGTLIISQTQQPQSTAVELILDASGSMLKRLNGQRRINIAKDVLINTVTEVIPQDTLVALRVFGDQQANACRTDLRLPLQPLNAAKAQSTIEQVNAKNLAKTPIAASLAKVVSDLQDHNGKKVVVLITDGEETCDGDPEKVINDLIEQGVDIRLNIVGFAIDDEALKSEFNQWSKLGNGKYFDSNNPDSLKQSIDEALQTPFSVFSLAGEWIADGTVNGEPLELPAGFYDIKIYANEVISHDQYQIKGEAEQEIKL